MSLIEKLSPENQGDAAKYRVSRGGFSFPVEQYRYDPISYIKRYFGWEPWRGDGFYKPGQVEVLAHYILCMRQQIERHDYLNGKIDKKDLVYYRPDMTIKNVISVDAGHNVGKTKIAAGILNHFFDCFPPAIIYSFAPTSIQIKDLLWKEVRNDREGKGLPGRTLNLRLEAGANHFAVGRATNDSGGTGTERAQGQHGDYLAFVIDEAEGVADFVFDAVDSMESGGVATLVVVIRNPRTPTCRAHKIRKNANVVPFRISCLNHPNVVTGKPLIPASVQRDWVDRKIDDWCIKVEAHDIKTHTFEVGWRKGIFKPVDDRFLWRVMGLVGSHNSQDVFVSGAVYEAAARRDAPVGDAPADFASIGVDCARFGDDVGTGWSLHAGVAKQFATWPKKDTFAYTRGIAKEARRLHAAGVERLSIRIDGGGGYGGGVIDYLRADADLNGLFKELLIHEVLFNARAGQRRVYADKITELYQNAADFMLSLKLSTPSVELERDLTERKYEWVVKGVREVKRLERKADFKKRVGRSPDSGDGFVLAVCSERLVNTFRESSIG